MRVVVPLLCAEPEKGGFKAFGELPRKLFLRVKIMQKPTCLPLSSGGQEGESAYFLLIMCMLFGATFF